MGSYPQAKTNQQIIKIVGKLLVVIVGFAVILAVFIVVLTNKPTIFYFL